jgi:hypothetical protein
MDRFVIIQLNKLTTNILSWTCALQFVKFGAETPLQFTNFIFVKKAHSPVYYKNILTIISEACTINVLLALALALAGVINYNCK